MAPDFYRQPRRCQRDASDPGQAPCPVWCRGSRCAGLDRICFVTGQGKRAIEDHFDVSFELESSIAGTGKEDALQGIRSLIAQCSFSYIRQREMLGLGAILTGRQIVGDEAFGVILADDLIALPKMKLA